MGHYAINAYSIIGKQDDCINQLSETTLMFDLSFKFATTEQDQVLDPSILPKTQLERFFP